MKSVRRLFGLIAILGIAAGLNVMVLKQEPFSMAVLLPLGAGLLAGLLWTALGLSSMAGELRRGRTVQGLNAAIASVVFMGICIVVYAFAAHFDKSWDLTKEGRRELSEQTIQVLQNLDEDVEVLCFFVNTGERMQDVAQEKTRRFLERCQKYTDHIRFEFYDTHKDVLKLREVGVARATPQGTIILKRGAQKRAISLQGERPRLEEREFTNTLINVVRSSQPRVCFMTGHGERDFLGDNDATAFYQALQMESYVPERIAMTLSAPEIPPNCDILVMNRPQRDFFPTELEAIKRYIDNGGRMLLLMEVMVRSSARANSVEQLRPWLEKEYGIVVGENLVASLSSRTEVHLVPDFAMLDAEVESEYRGSYDANHPLTMNMKLNMLLRIARTVTLAEKVPEGVDATVVLRSAPDTWAENNLEMVLKAQRANKDPDDQQGPLGVAVAATVLSNVPIGDTELMKEGRMLVIGSADISTNEGLRLGGNLDFMLNSIAWLSANEELIAIRPVGEEDPPLVLTKQNERAIAWIAILGALQVVVAAGLIMFLARRKYQ